MEDRIRKLEQDIHRLKTNYDQYFSGIERTSPEKLAAAVAREVRSLTATVINNTALRFRAQQAISRYNTYLGYWQRNLKDVEEGRKPRRRIAVAANNEGSRATNNVYEVSTGKSKRKEMEKLFEALSREYRKTDTGKVPDLSRVREALERQAKTIRDRYGCDKVAFKVVTEEGKVKIKAAPVSRSKS